MGQRRRRERAVTAIAYLPLVRAGEVIFLRRRDSRKLYDHDNSSSTLISKRAIIDWLGIAPFMIFALMFLVVPTLYLVTGPSSRLQASSPSRISAISSRPRSSPPTGFRSAYRSPPRSAARSSAFSLRGRSCLAGCRAGFAPGSSPFPASPPTSRAFRSPSPFSPPSAHRSCHRVSARLVRLQSLFDGVHLLSFLGLTSPTCISRSR